MTARKSSRTHGFTSLLLTLCGSLCLLHAGSKGLLWVAGARAVGRIAFQAREVSSRGATWVRYEFTASDGTRHGGSAMTSAKGVVNARVEVAYLRGLPDLNMPAYGGYQALLGGAWGGLGLLLLGVSRLFLRPVASRGPRKPV